MLCMVINMGSLQRTYTDILLGMSKERQRRSIVHLVGGGVVVLLHLIFDGGKRQCGQQVRLPKG